MLLTSIKEKGSSRPRHRLTPLHQTQRVRSWVAAAISGRRGAPPSIQPPPPPSMPGGHGRLGLPVINDWACALNLGGLDVDFGTMEDLARDAGLGSWCRCSCCSCGSLEPGCSKCSVCVFVCMCVCVCVRADSAGTVQVCISHADVPPRRVHYQLMELCGRSWACSQPRSLLLGSPVPFAARCVGGALSRSSGPSASRSELVRVPTPSLGEDLGKLLASGEGADCEFDVEDEVRAGQGAGCEFAVEDEVRTGGVGRASGAAGGPMAVP